MGEKVASGDAVLLTWRGTVEESVAKTRVEEMSQMVGIQGSVRVENLDMLLNSQHNSGQFNVILNGFLGANESQMIADELLVEMARVLKPGGRLVINKSQTEDCSTQKLMTRLKLSGFVKLEEDKDQISGQKPSYEIGSGVRLPFAGSVEPLKVPSAVWQLDAQGVEEGEDDENLVKMEELLDEDDLKKPDPASLKVCGTTGKRKACANCSCGLAEELENEVKDEMKKNTQNAKSSCGSCYLGDAFRCASCPYRGTPAFKPGEKVVIDNSSDI
jgi:hypothetical protein